MPAHLIIAHLTDLHIRRDYSGTMFDTELHQPIYPTPYFEIGLKQVASEQPDVLVLTGDLIHEGDADDYRFLKRLIEHYLPGIPVIPVVGNHDFKRAFYDGFLGEHRDGPYNDVHTINGYRFITLDTATEGCGNGAVTGSQVEWLLGLLKAPAENGTILLGHHPFRSQQAWFNTELEPGLIEALQDSDVIAYLCGHAHYLETRTIGSLLQITGESFDYGVETQPSRTEVVYTETRAYNTVWLEGRDLIAHAHFVFPFDPVIKRLVIPQH